MLDVQQVYGDRMIFYKYYMKRIQYYIIMKTDNLKQYDVKEKNMITSKPNICTNDKTS